MNDKTMPDTFMEPIIDLLDKTLLQTKNKIYLNLQGSLFFNGSINFGSTSFFEAIKFKIAETARTRRIMYMDSQLLRDTKLKEIIEMLENSENNFTCPSNWINFEDFCMVRNELDCTLKSFVPLTLYSQLYQNHPQGYISKLVLIEYLEKVNRYFELRIMLAVYDVGSTGYLTEDQFCTFLTDYFQNSSLIMTIEDEKFVEFYKIDILVWFTFICDPFRKGKMKILDIIKCGQLELFCDTHEKPKRLVYQFLKHGWFQIESSIGQYESFTKIGLERDGLINFEGLLNLQHSYYTYTYLFEAYNLLANCKGLMDYKAYSKFLAAAENVSEIQGLLFYFKILDINGDGYLDSDDIKFYYKEVYEKQQIRNPLNLIPVEHIISEIFDMVKPKEPDRFTADELVSTFSAKAIVRLLIASDGFYEYENMLNG